MRIRTIKPEFFLHHDLFRAERETGLPLRLSFVGLWCAADREGRFKWEPERLGVSILPYDGVDFSRVLHALVTRGFLEKYRCNSGIFGWVPSFSRHQFVNPKEKPSEIPIRSECTLCEVEDKDVTTREPRVSHAMTDLENLERVEGKGREGNKEGKGRDIATAVAGRVERPRNVAFDALAEVCGLNPSALSKGEGGRLGKALAGITQAVTLLSPGATPDAIAAEIRRRAANYRVNMPDCGLTPTGLENNWGASNEASRHYGQQNNRDRTTHTEAPNERFVSGRDELRKQHAAAAALDDIAMDGPVPL